MATKTLKTPQKITVKIWTPIIDKLDEKMRIACLRRDPYLARLLDAELPKLDEEVSLPNSPAAHAFVGTRLDALERKVVSLTLRPDLIEQLNDICRRKKIVRDAFFNRLFLLLAVAPMIVDKLLFGGDEWKAELWRDTRDDRNFWESDLYPLRSAIDPFWAIRVGLEIYAEATNTEDFQDPESGKTIRVERKDGAVYPVTSVYTKFFSDQPKSTDLTGMNCYVPDWRVPNTPAAFKRKQLDELLSI